MIQTYKDFEQAETEQIAKLTQEINHLRYTIRKIHECARQWEWGSYYTNTPEGFIYKTSKQEVMKWIK